MKASTVGELLELLKTVDPNSKWYGLDDGSLVVEDEKQTETIIDTTFYDHLERRL